MPPLVLFLVVRSIYDLIVVIFARADETTTNLDQQPTKCHISESDGLYVGECNPSQHWDAKQYRQHLKSHERAQKRHLPPPLITDDSDEEVDSPMDMSSQDDLSEHRILDDKP